MTFSRVGCPALLQDTQVWGEAVCHGKSKAAFPQPVARGDSVHPRHELGLQVGVPLAQWSQDGGYVLLTQHIHPCSCPLFICRCPVLAAAKDSLAWEAEGTTIQQPLKSMYLLLLVLFLMPYSKP